MGWFSPVRHCCKWLSRSETSKRMPRLVASRSCRRSILNTVARVSSIWCSMIWKYSSVSPNRSVSRLFWACRAMRAACRLGLKVRESTVVVA